MNVHAYRKLLEYFGIVRDVRIAAPIMFTAEIDDDILDRFHVDTKAVTASRPVSDFGVPEEFEDRPWRVRWRRSSDYTYAPVDGPFRRVARPAAEDVTRYPWPKTPEIADFTEWRERGKLLRQESDRALVARVVPGVVTLAQYMRGFEEWMTDLIVNREFSDALHARLCEIWIESVGIIVEALGDNVDVIMFGEDLGLQNQPIMSPAMFRERVKPLMKKMVGAIKQRTQAKIALHTCGSVFAYIDDFNDIGIDALNPLQSNAGDMDPVRIKERTAGKIALWGGIDTHEVLPRGNTRDVHEEVKRKTAAYGKGGGYVLSADHNILVDVPPENLIAMFEAAREYGSY